MNYFSEIRNIEFKIATITDELFRITGLPLFASYEQRLKGEIDSLTGCVITLNDIIDERL